MHTKYLLENLKGKEYLGDLGVNGSQGYNMWGCGGHWLTILCIGRFCGHGNEPLVSMQGV
jgi:hypothetical protein